MLVFTDLGNDYINPHEATRRVNATVIPELAAIGMMALLHLCTFNPLFLLLLPVVLFKAHKFRANQLVIDVTDIFSRVGAEKTERYDSGERMRCDTLPVLSFSSAHSVLFRLCLSSEQYPSRCESSYLRLSLSLSHYTLS